MFEWLKNKCVLSNNENTVGVNMLLLGSLMEYSNQMNYS